MMRGMSTTYTYCDRCGWAACRCEARDFEYSIGVGATFGPATTPELEADRERGIARAAAVFLARFPQWDAYTTADLERCLARMDAHAVQLGDDGWMAQVRSDLYLAFAYRQALA